MLRFCLGAYGRPNHAWMPSLGAGLIRLSQTLGPKQLMTVSTVLLAMSSAGLITGRVFLQVIDCTRLLFCHSRLFCHTQPL